MTDYQPILQPQAFVAEIPVKIPDVLEMKQTQSENVFMHPTSSHSEDDPMALLPRYTKVRVLGNNRTKASLIGQEAVVKRAVGLGGWHWLTLENGDEIKLQRNALMVLEYPTGQEHESSASEDDEQHHHPHSPYHRPSPGPQIPRYYPAATYGGGVQKKRVHRPPAPFTAEEYNGQGRVSQRSAPSQTRINFSKLDNATLRRYTNFYRLADAEANFRREELLNTISNHFSAQEIDEGAVIQGFLAAAKRHSQGLPRTSA